MSTTTAPELPAKTKKREVVIAPLNLQVAEFVLEGTAPLCMNRFGPKMRQKMMDDQAAGSTGTKNRKRTPKDFEALYNEAMHKSRDGWLGFPAPSLRNALIETCRTAGFKMTVGKMVLFVIADGHEREDNTPLVRIYGKVSRYDAATRNATGVADIRTRPLWKTWRARVRIQYDGDFFTLDDVTNLLSRAGVQNGLGEGRPNSKDSAGIGFGTFRIVNGKPEDVPEEIPLAA